MSFLLSYWVSAAWRGMRGGTDRHFGSGADRACDREGSHALDYRGADPGRPRQRPPRGSQSLRPHGHPSADRARRPSAPADFMQGRVSGENPPYVFGGDGRPRSIALASRTPVLSAIQTSDWYHQHAKPTSLLRCATRKASGYRLGWRRPRRAGSASWRGSPAPCGRIWRRCRPR